MDFIKGNFSRSLSFGFLCLLLFLFFSASNASGRNTLGFGDDPLVFQGSTEFPGWAPAFSLDQRGYIVVTGLTDELEMTTTQYDPDGTLQWETLSVPPYNPYNYDPKTMATDEENNIYIAGNRCVKWFGDWWPPFCASYDRFLMKYNQNGELQWLKEMGPAFPIEDFQQLAYNGNGSVVGLGWRGRLLSSVNYLATAYDASGNLSWQNVYASLPYSMASTIDLSDAARMAVSSEGKIHVFGCTNTQCITVKYDRLGHKVWEVSNSGLFYVSKVDISLDASGNVYVLGGNATGPKIVKYDRNGNLQWMTDLANIPADSFRIEHMTCDSEGNVYATGKLNLDQEGSSAFYTMKFNTEGRLLWGESFTHPTYKQNTAFVVSPDEDGRVIVAGISEGEEYYLNTVSAVLYNSDGTVMGQYLYDCIECNSFWADMSISFSDPNHFCLFVTQNPGMILKYFIDLL